MNILYLQKYDFDCGYACVKSICAFYSIEYDYSLDAFNSRNGSNINFLINIFKSKGLNSLAVKTKYEKIIHSDCYPLIAYYKAGHFIIIYSIENDILTIGDPLTGIQKINKDIFLNAWLEDGVGIIIFIYKQ